MLEHKPDKRALKIVPMTQACMHGYDLQYNQIFFFLCGPTCGENICSHSQESIGHNAL